MSIYFDSNVIKTIAMFDYLSFVVHVQCAPTHPQMCLQIHQTLYLCPSIRMPRYVSMEAFVMRTQKLLTVGHGIG